MSLKGQAMTDNVLRGKITNIRQIEAINALYAEVEKLAENTSGAIEEANVAAQMAGAMAEFAGEKAAYAAKTADDLIIAKTKGEFNGKDGEVQNYQVANALKGQASGTSFGISDVSPLEHELSVKYEIENLSGYDVGDGEDSVNYSVSGIRFEYIGYSEWKVFGTALSTVTFSASSNTAGFEKKHIPAGTYIISGAPAGSSLKTYYIKAAFREIHGDSSTTVYDDFIFEEGATVTFANDIESVYFAIRILNGVSVDGLSFVPTIIPASFTVEVHGTSLDVLPRSYKPNEYGTFNGTISGIMSIYPSTILIASSEYVTLHVEYNRDINKAFAELLAKIEG